MLDNRVPGPQVLKRTAVAVLMAVTAIGLALMALHVAERKVLFPAPAATASIPVLGENVKFTRLESPRFQVEGFLLLPDRPPEGRIPLMEFAHGNGELVDHWLSRFEPITKKGIAVLLVEYPGYGRSSGNPSEESIQLALAAGYDWAASLPYIDTSRIIGYGISLGGGAICALARIRPFAALILESTFTSIPDFVAERPPPVAALRHLLRNRFESLAFLRGYQAPVLVLHGDRDEMIPMAHGRALAKAAIHSELSIAHCGHNDCPRPWATLIEFLGKHGLLSGAP